MVGFHSTIITHGTWHSHGYLHPNIRAYSISPPPPVVALVRSHGIGKPTEASLSMLGKSPMRLANCTSLAMCLNVAHDSLRPNLAHPATTSASVLQQVKVWQQAGRTGLK
eukprot:scaffold32964_cov33-Tisochrysis_lutea.AAC.2